MANFDLDYSELLLERKENKPQAKTVVKATVIAKSSKALYVDINKSFEAYIPNQELGSKKVEEYKIGDRIEAYLAGEQNPDGIFKLSIKQIEIIENWKQLEDHKGQNIELTISKIVKSGVEAEIATTKQIGFIPNRYLDTTYSELKYKKQSEWIGVKIPGRIHELDQSKNKIILNNKVISEEQRAAKADETLTQVSVGQVIEGNIVRVTDFGAFIDIGGLDALIPASELSWRRFKKPSDVIQAGQKVKAKIFRIEIQEKKVGLSIKQAEPDPWTILPEECKVGHKLNGKVVTHADFGVFLEVYPGVEALLHKSNIQGEAPEMGKSLEIEIINIEADKKRMGVKVVEATNPSNETNSSETDEGKEPEKELEYAN